MPKFILFFLLSCLFVVAKGQTANFSYQSTNGLYCSPATVHFTQTCTGSPLAFSWNFGNGQFSSAANPSVVFAAGTYVVKLLAIFDNSTAEYSEAITINPGITAAITADRNYICKPGNINFAASTNAAAPTYSWNFGDGGTSSASAPTYPYAGFGNFAVTLNITDATGCSGIANYNINVAKIPVGGTVTPVNGCVPAIASFNATTTLPAGATVVDYAWDFGDGTFTNGPASTSTKTYNITTPITATVTVITNEGCTNLFTFPTIAFGIPPTGLIAYSTKNVYCGSEKPVFVSKATNADKYVWDFGDGNTGTATDTLIQHKYLTLGTKTVKVIPFFHGCQGTSASFNIDIIGVIASFDYSNSCSDKKTFSFLNTTQGNQSTTTWDFGDGSPTVSSLNPIHTFPTAGSFITTLSVTDNITGCSDMFQATIYSADPVVTNPDISICRNDISIFTVKNAYTNPAVVYTWHILGLLMGPFPNNPFPVKASVFGDHAINFVEVDNGPQYCKDSLYLDHPVRVRGPNLAFNSPAAVCANGSITVTNNSTPYFATDLFKMTYWNYGKAAANDTIFQPAAIVYPTAGNYNIKLVSEDITGCRDSLIKPLRVDPLPFLHVIPRNDTLCSGQKDTLVAFHEGTITWSPVTFLSCTTCDSVVANPNATTMFYATALTALGCTSTDSAKINVYAPFTATPFLSPAYVCLNDSLHINVLPAGKRVLWVADPTLSATTIYNPTAKPLATKSYVVKLTDSAGCYSSSTAVLVVVKSLPTVNAGPDLIVPYNASFTITPTYSNNIVDYKWAPPGTLTCTNCAIPNGIADKAYVYSITVKSDSGCVAKDTVTVFIECKYANLLVPTAFTPNGDNKNDLFIPYMRGIKKITKFLIYNRSGQLMYEVKDMDPANSTLGWNGRFKGEPQSAGAYVYFLEALCDVGETITRQGSFVLLR